MRSRSDRWLRAQERARREKKLGKWPEPMWVIRRGRPDIWPREQDERERAQPAPALGALERLTRYVETM